MTLNNDCIRDVLLQIEKHQLVLLNSDDEVEMRPLDIEALYCLLPGYYKEDIFYSLFVLEQAGHINLSVHWIAGSVCECSVNYMTFEGHEFLNGIRDATNWSKISKGISAVRNYSLSAISAIADGVTSAAISAYLAQRDL